MSEVIVYRTNDFDEETLYVLWNGAIYRVSSNEISELRTPIIGFIEQSERDKFLKNPYMKQFEQPEIGFCIVRGDMKQRQFAVSGPIISIEKYNFSVNSIEQILQLIKNYKNSERIHSVSTQE
jgi:hypothetical protein